MSKDSRYSAIKALIENNNMSGLKQIFTILPISVLKQDLKVNYNTLRRRIYNTELMTVKDIRAIAQLIEVTEEKILQLCLMDLQQKRPNKKKQTE